MLSVSFRALVALAVTAVTVALTVQVARADLDGHGPDAWRVTGVESDDVLNVRMGPGTAYPVIETFAPDERGLEQITCVPYLTLTQHMAMTEAEINALPPTWCLMRDSAMIRAGWVAQRFIEPDNRASDSRQLAETSGDPLIAGAESLVRDLYDAFESTDTSASNPFSPHEGRKYFFNAIVPRLSGHGADVLYAAQDFRGEVTRIAADPDQPMLRGMVTINVDFINWGRKQRAVFRLRADAATPSAPFRIFRVEHEDWSFPE